MSYVVSERRGEGWLFFAAVVLGTAGLMRLTDAWWAFAENDALRARLRAVWFGDNLAVYGLFWLVTGLLLIAAAFGVMSGSATARRFGIAAAALSALGALVWAYDLALWSLVGVVVAVLVIYALTAYGGRPGDDARPRVGHARRPRTAGRGRASEAGAGGQPGRSSPVASSAR